MDDADAFRTLLMSAVQSIGPQHASVRVHEDVADEVIFSPRWRRHPDDPDVAFHVDRVQDAQREAAALRPERMRMVLEHVTGVERRRKRKRKKT